MYLPFEHMSLVDASLQTAEQLEQAGKGPSAALVREKAESWRGTPVGASVVHRGQLAQVLYVLQHDHRTDPETRQAAGTITNYLKLLPASPELDKPDRFVERNGVEYGLTPRGHLYVRPVDAPEPTMKLVVEHLTPDGPPVLVAFPAPLEAEAEQAVRVAFNLGLWNS